MTRRCPKRWGLVREVQCGFRSLVPQSSDTQCPQRLAGRILKSSFKAVSHRAASQKACKRLQKCLLRADAHNDSAYSSTKSPRIRSLATERWRRSDAYRGSNFPMTTTGVVRRIVAGSTPRPSRRRIAGSPTLTRAASSLMRSPSRRSVPAPFPSMRNTHACPSLSHSIRY